MKTRTKNHTAEHTIPVSAHTSLRLYPDTRPHNCQIADIQKGLILVHKGTERVGEGTGFGVPIARYDGKTYFSSASTVQISGRDGHLTAIKEFSLDTVAEKNFAKVKMDNGPIYKLMTYVDELYREHKHLRLLTLANLSKNLGLQTNFVKTKTIGTVTIAYKIKPPMLHVEVNLDSLRKNKLETVFLSNEQSSRFFAKYHDSSGTILYGRKIGAWEKVNGEWACILNKTSDAGFRLWKVKDAILYRGREYLADFFDWAGLDYEIGCEKTRFEYDIEILGS